MSSFDGVIGLGSNLDSPERRIERALTELEARHVETVRRSSLYRTEPRGGPVQPWYVNAVAAVRFPGSPLELLRVCQSVEGLHGRARGERNGPRTLDLDLLLFGGTILDTEELALPHPRLRERRFVLVPLVEIAPELRDPVTGLTMEQLLARCDDRGRVVPLGEGIGLGARV